jgi:AraC family transcriptional regulator of adaptative response/methylated-DNA-[protein]-cysteine methyltransferase
MEKSTAVQPYANHLAIAIPCQRAIGSDGSLAGFHWGKTGKRRLLDLEAQMPR